ncbi:hypothetical protein K2Z84_24290 [Candidatus Binatia bacterium]|jgi:hypothetical protein|nr:hypothetical protein [Candidatus Binatia bacterium]
MPTVTAAIVVVAFLSGCATAVAGYWVGRGQSPVSLVLNWGALTLVLQLFAACVAVVHARAGRPAVPSDPGAAP